MRVVTSVWYCKHIGIAFVTSSSHLFFRFSGMDEQTDRRRAMELWPIYCTKLSNHWFSCIGLCCNAWACLDVQRVHLSDRRVPCRRSAVLVDSVWQRSSGQGRATIRGSIQAETSLFILRGALLCYANCNAMTSSYQWTAFNVYITQN